MRHATLALAAAAVLALAPQAQAQCTGTPGQDFERVTVRELNAIPQANIDQLNALSDAGTLTTGDIQSLLTNDLEGVLVEFQAVFMTDPILSGLASLVNGIPGRIHVFTRDVNALTMGVEGMGIQIVDNRADGQIQNFFKFDEVIVCGVVGTFTGSGGRPTQVTPVSINLATAPVVDPGANPEFYDPVVVSVDDFHDVVAGDLTQIDFDSYSDFNGQYVRLENATVVQGVQGTRPNVLLSSDANGDAPQVNVYDTSVCFRNDRDETYFPPGQVPACIDDDFVPPATGTANVQGFLIYQGDTGGFNYSSPNGANFVINPFEEEDFEVASAPPIVSVMGPDTTPGPNDDVTITATIVAGGGTINSATINYAYVVDGTTVQSGMAPMTNTGGDDYEGTIPARTEPDANGAFVVYSVTATDTDGGTTTTDDQAYLVFEGAIDSISLIQRTFDGGPGDSPLATGNPATFDLDATVQTVFQSGSNWFMTLQDDADLDPFTGVWVFLGGADPGLTAGAEINVTEATVEERFGLTQLTDVTFTVTSASGTPYPYKEVTTDLFNGPGGDDVFEQHEGMALSFDNVTIVDLNPDAPAGPFGEFLFSSDGTIGNGVRADDFSNGIEYTGNDPDELLDLGTVVDFVRGPLYYSFSNYKLVPVTTADIGMVVTSTDGGPEATTVRIEGAYPNPVSGSARVLFELDAAGPATLALYDVTGRQVSVLAQGDFVAAAHAATLDASALASGVYVLRLQAGGEVTTARVSVVR